MIEQPKKAGERIAHWVALSLEGDCEAYGDLVRRHENAAFATALSYGVSREDAADVVQESFIAAYVKLAELREPDRFGWWVRSIVQRRALGFLRRRRKVEFISPEADAGQAALVELSEGAERSRQARSDLEEAVRLLPVEYREMVLMHYAEGVSYATISRCLGVPVSTIKGRLHRARGLLKGLLSGPEGKGHVMEKSVAEGVKNAVYQIAKRHAEEKVPLKGAARVVIYCGMRTELEVCRTDGADVVVTSTAATIGADRAAAERSLEGLKVVTDRVSDYVSAGPFPEEAEPVGGVLNMPITKANPSKLEKIGQGNSWRDALIKRSRRMDKLLGAEGVFPQDHRETERRLAEEILATEGPAVRVTTMREEGEAIAMDRSAYTDEVRRVLPRGVVTRRRCSGNARAGVAGGGRAGRRHSDDPARRRDARDPCLGHPRPCGGHQRVERGDQRRGGRRHAAERQLAQGRAHPGLVPAHIPRSAWRQLARRRGDSVEDRRDGIHRSFGRRGYRRQHGRRGDAQPFG